MTCMGHHDIKPPICKKFVRKTNVRTNVVLENGVMCLYNAFQYDVINASTTYTNYTLGIK